MERDLILIFTIEGSKFAIGIENLIEVSEDLEVEKKYKLEGCSGVLMFRGEIVPLVDIKGVLGFNEAVNKGSAFLIINVNDVKLGIPVDTVDGVIERKSQGLPFPDILLRVKGVFPYVYDLDGEMVLVVDFGVLLAGILTDIVAQE